MMLARFPGIFTGCCLLLALACNTPPPSPSPDLAATVEGIVRAALPTPHPDAPQGNAMAHPDRELEEAIKRILERRAQAQATPAPTGQGFVAPASTPWPAADRELEEAIERILEQMAQAQATPAPTGQGFVAPAPTPWPTADRELEEAIERILEQMAQAQATPAPTGQGFVAPPPTPWPTADSELEEAIKRILEQMAQAQATATPTLQDFVAPTSTPRPTAGPTATSTPWPTRTPRPAATSQPTATPLTPPVIPPIVSISEGAEWVKVTWKRPDPPPTNTTYEVRYRVVGGSWSTPVVRPWGVDSHRIGPVGYHDRYEVQVRAVNAAGASPWSKTGVSNPVPTPTPEPTPVPSPTPLSNAYGMGCVGHESLDTDTPQDIKQAAWFQNPPEIQENPWDTPRAQSFSYGFIVRNVEGTGILALVTSEKTWIVELRVPGVRTHMTRVSGGGWLSHSRGSKSVQQGFTVLSSGSLDGYGIPFDTAPAAQNHLAFIAEGNRYELVVNGYRMLLNSVIEQSDLDRVEGVIGKYRYYDTGEWRGTYAITRQVGDDGQPSPTTGGRYLVGDSWRPLPSVACAP